jgi:hypothetical protein
MLNDRFHRTTSPDEGNVPWFTVVSLIHSEQHRLAESVPHSGIYVFNSNLSMLLKYFLTDAAYGIAT